MRGGKSAGPVGFMYPILSLQLNDVGDLLRLEEVSKYVEGASFWNRVL